MTTVDRGKIILSLLAGGLLLSAASLTASEGDFDFLPDPVAKIGQRVIERDYAIRLLTSESGRSAAMSRQEVVLKLRQMLEAQIEIAVLEMLLRRHQLVPGPDLVRSEAERRFRLLPENRRWELLAELREQGLTFDAYVERLSRDRDEQLRAAIAKWLAQADPARFEVTDAEAEDYYRMRQGLFLIPEQVAFSRIEIGKTSGGRNPEQSRRLIESVAARLRQGEPFERLAEQFDECVVGAQETLPRVALPLALAEALFAMRPGETSEIIILADSFVIVRHNKLVSAHYVPFAEVRDFIKEQLLNTKIRHYLAQEMRRERAGLVLEFYF